MYHVEFARAALKELRKMDRQTAAMIIGWIRKNLEGCNNPRQYGKGSSTNRSRQWRYRIGDYRLLAEIQSEIIVILMIHVGRCSETYNRKEESKDSN